MNKVELRRVGINSVTLPMVGCEYIKVTHGDHNKHYITSDGQHYTTSDGKYYTVK